MAYSPPGLSNEPPPLSVADRPVALVAELSRGGWSRVSDLTGGADGQQYALHLVREAGDEQPCGSDITSVFARRREFGAFVGRAALLGGGGDLVCSALGEHLEKKWAVHECIFRMALCSAALRRTFESVTGVTQRSSTHSVPAGTADRLGKQSGFPLMLQRQSVRGIFFARLGATRGGSPGILG